MIGYSLAAACLVWVFHDVSVRELSRYIRNISWRWIALAIVADILSYLCQAWRWRLLLKPVGKLSLITAAQAIYAGLFVNEILPMRLGEFVRAFLISRRLSTRLTTVVPSIVVERLLDGIILTIGLVLSANFVSLPKDLRQAGGVFALLTLIGMALFVYLVPPQKDSANSSTDLARGGIGVSRVKAFVTSILLGLQAIRYGKNLYLSFAVSVVFLVLQVLAFWLIMRAYGLEFSFWIGAIVFLVVHLGTAIPNAPANVGTYQFFTVVGLALFGVDKTVATGFSIVVFVLLTAPLWVLGFISLISSGLTLTQLSEKMRSLSIDSE